MTGKPKTSSLRKLRSRKPDLVVILCGLLCLTGCEQALYDRYRQIDQKRWGKDKVYYFTFEVPDTSVMYDLTLNIRNNNLYPYQNLWLFCSEERPVGPLLQDTMECMLADEFGKWYGQGISLFESSFPIRTRYKFPHIGQYTFGFRQGMRNDTLIGIQEIGLTIRPSANR